ncbi:hypothetical protein SAMN05216303_11248 [Rhodoferax sp. OV413]|uniref:hypothetical protein n=1 Tax=Rhodoferax sp. OV413 TaxID=1855285 RepID=UPI000880DAA8|nr:hypothetical protein [Rhodoferax sp. OV413]SDP93453.1 hypothetical protein SAMN05216303_11248 [Rhodoferax sp. OV413]
MAANHSSLGLEASLSTVEQLLDDVSSALLAGEPLVLEAASTSLRQAMVDMARVVPAATGLKSLDANMRLRLAKISLTLTQQRESLIRRAVVVDRTLVTVLPQAQSLATYSGGVKAAAYRGGSARIYAAVAT